MPPSIPTVVNLPVFPLSSTAPAPPPPPPTAVPAPFDAPKLGVRIYNNQGKAIDAWVTSLVDDITFRSVVPGGFASATITLHNDQQDSVRQLAQLYNRVQIVDLRTSEIAWEGRIETAPRNTADDTWQLGCLGPMVAASDIQRPMFYADSDVGNWYTYATKERFFGAKINSDEKSLSVSPPGGPVDGGPAHNPLIIMWEKARTCDVYIGRFDATYSGSCLSAVPRTGIDVIDSSETRQDNVDLTAWNAAEVRKTNKVGTDITSVTANRLEVAWDLASGSYTRSDSDIGQVIKPRIQVQRVDETGAKLRTAADYPNEWVTVEQIVRDVVGRFLVSAWHVGGNNTPYPGQVRPNDSYIDTSSTAQITHLTYYDGTTAAEIFDDLMTAQPNAYWALWESRYGATDGAAGQIETGFRFEWATWPSSWGYQATSIDGLEEQPDGGGLRNFLFYQYPLDTDPPATRVQTWWDTDNQNQLLTDARLVRGVTVKAEEPQSASTASTRAQSKFAEYKRTINTGTLTVRRPIQFYDPGANSNSGASRMLDPWMIKPGKLIRITDIPPRAASNDFRHGASAFAPELDGTVFRVVSTEYSSADNSCRLELDQVPAWSVATQVARTPIPGGKVVVRG